MRVYSYIYQVNKFSFNEFSRIRLIKQNGQSPLRIYFRIALGMISSERNVRAFITAHETPKTKASVQNNPYTYLSVWKALLGR